MTHTHIALARITRQSPRPITLPGAVYTSGHIVRRPS